MRDCRVSPEDADELLRGVDAAHEAALFASSRIRMDDALGSSLVDALHGETKVVAICGGACAHGCRLDASTQFALDSLVALSALGVRDDALLLALNVCHGW